MEPSAETPPLTVLFETTLPVTSPVMMLFVTTAFPETAPEIILSEIIPPAEVSAFMVLLLILGEPPSIAVEARTAFSIKQPESVCSS